MYVTAWYAGQEVPSWPAYQAVTYTEWYIPDNVLRNVIPVVRVENIYDEG